VTRTPSGAPFHTVQVPPSLNARVAYAVIIPLVLEAAEPLL
jgi:hypothetical protein